MNFLPAYRLKLYRDFKSIEAADYHSIARYYERFEQDIHLLDFDEYFDCLASYTQALFEMGDYRKHLVMCDFLLETIIMHNVETWGGEDLYTKTLFAKAASLYHLQEYQKAEHILQELIKINPHTAIPAKTLWEKCLLRQKPGWLMQTRALAIGLLLFTALFIAVEIFVITPFFSAYQIRAQWVHNLLLASGISILLMSEMRHTWLCKRMVRHFIQVAQQRKGS